MPRLFIAIHLPQSVKTGLLRHKMTIPTARWSDESQFHLTLRFLGDVPEAKIATLQKNLATINTPAFEMMLKGVGCFPQNIKKPTRVLWAGVSAPQALFDLQKQIEETVIRAGFGAEDKPFSPHITLARLKTEVPLSEVALFLKNQHGYISESFMVNEFVLVESLLLPQGAKYADRRVFSLIPNTSPHNET